MTDKTEEQIKAEKAEAAKKAKAEKAEKAKAAKAAKAAESIEYNGYKGAPTEIVVLAEEIPVKVGEPYSAYGVPCIHEVIKKDDTDEAGEDIKVDVHILSSTVPEPLAKEMIKVKRAHLRKDVVK